MVILHRHQGQLKLKGGALGISMFFLLQSYKAQSGGISKCIRNNATSLVVFSNKSEKQLDEIAEECAGEVNPEVFKEVYKMALQDKHDFCLWTSTHGQDTPCSEEIFQSSSGTENFLWYKKGRWKIRPN